MTPGKSTLKNQLDAMVEKGIDCFDPVRFSYIESLARKAAAMPEAVRRELEKKATDALADYEACFNRAQDEAKALMAQLTPMYPEAVDPLQRLFSANDFRGITKMARRLNRVSRHSPLGGVLEQLSGENLPQFQKTATALEDRSHPREDETANAPERSAFGGDDPGLKSYRLFKEAWARHYSDRLVSDAVRQLPDSPGPLNSQMLITRSLIIMRDLSPHYLKRFVSYVDTLFWLEDAAGKLPFHE